MLEFELGLIHIHMAQYPVLRVEEERKVLVCLVYLFKHNLFISCFFLLSALYAFQNMLGAWCCGVYGSTEAANNEMKAGTIRLGGSLILYM